MKISEESKRAYILLGIGVACVLAIVLSIIITNLRSKKVLDEVSKLMASTEAKAVYIMRDGCSYCTLNKSNMDSIVKEYGFEYLNVNTNDLTSSDLNKLISMLELDANNFGTPYLVVVKEGKTVAGLNGLKSYNLLFDFVKENKLIPEDSKLYLNYITYSDYKKLIKSSEREMIVLASSTCTYCLAEHPELIQIAKETGAKINFAYLDYMFNSQEEYNEFLSSLDWFTENSKFGTPTTLIVKNKVVKSSLTGYREKDELVNYMKENGIIK